MSAKILPILLILFVLIGCQAEQSANVSSGDATTFNPEFDTPPEVSDLLPGNILEDTETTWIFLSFSDAENHTPTSCQIFNRSYVNVTSPCTCSFGICYLKVTPFTNYAGPVSFQYSVTANNLTSNPANVSFSVIGVSESPVANDRSISLIENTSYVSDGTISAPHLSGSDPDGDSVTCSKVTDPASGSVTVNADCSFSYVPVANFEGTVDFTFKVNDGGSDSLPATVTINVLHDNVDSVADDVTVSLYQNIAKDITMTFTDPDPSDPWELMIISAPTKGTLSGTGFTLTYTPNANYIGTDSFTYKVFDGTSHSNLATVSITVQPTTIYLRSTGDDSTGTVNDPALPFLTAQAAADTASSLAPTDETPVVIDVGTGNFGNMVFTYNFGSGVIWKGAGAGVSIVGDISTNGFDGIAGTATGDPTAGDYDGGPAGNASTITIDSDLTVTFGNISANGGNGGAHAIDSVTYAAFPGDPGNGGILDLKGYFGTISARGGDGHGGGAGGDIRLRSGSTSLAIDASGGLDLCTTASFCGTAQGSGNGGAVQIDATAAVAGNITSKGGENLGNALGDLYVGGTGGTIVVFGTVTGNISANGGDSYDSQAGEGGSVDIKGGALVTGDVSVLNGVATNTGVPNFAGSVEVSGTVQDIYAHAISGFGGGASEIVVRGTVRDIFAQTDVLSCDIAAAGQVLIYIPAVIRNIYAYGGDKTCDTAGAINIFGTVTGVASVDGGDSSTATMPGAAGYVRLNNGSNVNSISAIGGAAGVGTFNDGGAGGVVDIYSGSIYDLLTIDVSGGAGDTGNGNANGSAGTVTEF